MIDAPPAELWTVGHSTLSADAFLALLAGHGIKVLADVRRYPASRRSPHFNAPALAALLRQADIGYVPFSNDQEASAAHNAGSLMRMLKDPSRQAGPL